jgi:outer membrane immunogenic protein
MKRSLALTIFLTAVTGLTICFAGTERYASKEVAPAPPVCDWSGFYVGLNVGVTEYTARFTDDGDWDTFATREQDTAAFIGGGQVGYNLQFGQLVLGLEADASGLAGAKVSKFSSNEDQGDYGKVDLLTTFRGRMGIAVDKALIFVSGGGAYAHGKWLESYIYSPPNSFYNAYWQGNDWRWGWTGGAGIEYMLNCNWSIRAEALYTWLNDDPTSITGPKNGYYYNQGQAYRDSYKFTFDDNLWSYRVGLNYKFGKLFGR